MTKWSSGQKAAAEAPATLGGKRWRRRPHCSCRPKNLGFQSRKLKKFKSAVTLWISLTFIFTVQSTRSVCLLPSPHFSLRHLRGKPLLLLPLAFEFLSVENAHQVHRSFEKSKKFFFEVAVKAEPISKHNARSSKNLKRRRKKVQRKDLRFWTFKWGHLKLYKP